LNNRFVAAMLVLICSVMVPVTAFSHAGKPSLVSLRVAPSTVEADLRVWIPDLVKALPGLSALGPTASLEQRTVTRKALEHYLSRHFHVARGGRACSGRWQLDHADQDAGLAYLKASPTS